MTDDYPPQSSFATGIRCACPRCGKGKLYDGVLTFAGRCGVCGLNFGRLNVDDGAAFFIIVGYSALVIPLALWLEFAMSPPIWVHVAVWVPVIVGGAILLMRVLKAWLAAQHFRHGVTADDAMR